MFNVYILYPQCGETVNCPNKKYPYHQCYGGSKKVICSNNPQAERPVIRKPTNFPICLEYNDDKSPEEVSMPKQTGGDITVFRRDLVQNDIDCALDEWDCLCDKKNAPCGCKIKLSWSTDIRDFTIKKLQSLKLLQ